jgi:hypothetical protein
MSLAKVSFHQLLRILHAIVATEVWFSPVISFYIAGNLGLREFPRGKVLIENVGRPVPDGLPVIANRCNIAAVWLGINGRTTIEKAR